VARLYSNENFPQPVVEELRRLGHDVLTSYEAGRANQGISDEQVIADANRDDRTVLTLNRVDFHREHTRSTTHVGIITCTVDLDRAALAARIHAKLMATPDLKGQLIKVRRGD
jgi:hypothetical protein